MIFGKILFLNLVTLTSLNTVKKSTSECNRNHFKFVAALMIRGEIFCGGVLITLSSVLTSAQCIDQQYIRREYLAVRVGPPDSSGQIKQVIKGIQHPKFLESGDLNYDIALVFMLSDVLESPHVSAAKLPTAGFTDQCTWGTAVAWARSTSSRTLKCAHLKLVNSTECEQLWPGVKFAETMICTVDMKACLGEVGGVLICRDTIIGILSNQQRCYQRNAMGTYTKVEHLLKFVNDSSNNGGKNFESGKKLFVFCLLYVFITTEMSNKVWQSENRDSRSLLLLNFQFLND